MQIAPPRLYEFTDDTGAIIFAFPSPSLDQIEECIKLDVPTPETTEDALSRHRRILAQLVVLTVPRDSDEADRDARTAWLRGLQYHQLLDVYRKTMLTVQGIDFETIEEFEHALAAQKKSTLTGELSPDVKPSLPSENSAPASP